MAIAGIASRPSRRRLDGYTPTATKGTAMATNSNALHREEDPDDLAIVMHRIEILDYIDTDGERRLLCSAEDADGNAAPLIEALGGLRLAEDTFIRQYMGEVPEEEDEEDDDEQD